VLKGNGVLNIEICSNVHSESALFQYLYMKKEKKIINFQASFLSYRKTKIKVCVTILLNRFGHFEMSNKTREGVVDWPSFFVLFPNDSS